MTRDDSSRSLANLVGVTFLPRIISILVYGAVSALAAHLVLQFGEDRIEDATEWVCDACAIPTQIILSILFVLVLAIVLNFAGITRRNMFLIAFPSHLWSLLPTLAILKWLSAARVTESGTGFYACALTLWSISLAMCIAWKELGRILNVGRGKAGGSGARPKLPVAESNTIQVLESLLAPEAPGDSPENDLLGSNRAAGRLFRAIQSPDISCIAIIGTAGSGKSTLFNLLARMPNALENHGFEYLSVSVSLWGISDAPTAAIRILEAIISSVGSRIDCLSLKSLPQKFISVLSESRFAALSTFFKSEPANPRTQLSAINDRLRAARLTMMVAVQDPDRLPTEIQQSGAIQRLVSEFRGFSQIRLFWLSETMVDSEYSKLCDYVEVVPHLSAEEVRHLLMSLSIGLSERSEASSKGVVGIRRTTYWFAHAIDPGIASRIQSSHHLVSAALASLIATPRRLKQIARRVDRAWAVIGGNADLDELILITTLRICVPQVFDQISEAIAVLRYYSAGDDKDLSGAKKIASELLDALVAVIPMRVRQVKIVLAALLRDASPLLGVAVHHEGPRPQSVNLTGRINYLLRLTREEVIAPSIPDGIVQDSIAGFVKGDPDSLRLVANLLESDEWAGAFEDLCPDVEESVFGRMVLGVCLGIVAPELSVKRWELPEGFFALWRLSRRRSQADASFLDAVLKSMAFWGAKSAVVTNELYYYWSSSKMRSYASQEFCRKMRRVVRAATSEAVNVSPDAFDHFFDTSIVTALCHYVRPNLMHNDREEEHVLEGLEFMGACLLESLRAGKSGIPLMLAVASMTSKFICTPVFEERDVPNAEVDEEVVAAMCGAYKKDILKLVASSQPIKVERWVTRAWDAFIGYAKSNS